MAGTDLYLKWTTEWNREQKFTRGDMLLKYCTRTIMVQVNNTRPWHGRICVVDSYFNINWILHCDIVIKIKILETNFEMWYFNPSSCIFYQIIIFAALWDWNNTLRRDCLFPCFVLLRLLFSHSAPHTRTAVKILLSFWSQILVCSSSSTCMLFFISLYL